LQFTLNTHVNVNHLVNHSNFFLRVKVIIRKEYYSKNPVCMSKYKTTTTYQASNRCG